MNGGVEVGGGRSASTSENAPNAEVPPGGSDDPSSASSSARSGHSANPPASSAPATLRQQQSALLDSPRNSAQASRPVTPPVNQQVPPPENVIEESVIQGIHDLTTTSATTVVPRRPSRTGSSRRDGTSNSGSVVIPVGSPTNLLPSRRHNKSSKEEKGSVRERNATMLYNDLMADVWFQVGQPGSSVRIPAHSYVLATASSVFYAMFYGAFQKSSEILIPDVQPVSFKIMLKYLYTDEIDLEAETVLGCLYCAKKYWIGGLTKACINYLETSLTAHNVCLLLTQSRLFEEEELMQRCWEVIDAQTEAALLSDGFLDVDSNTFTSILTRETLNTKEIHVFKAAIRWAKAECVRKGLDPELTDNLRNVLSDNFYQIRLPSMTIQEFANGPAQSGLLSYQETTQVFLWFTSEKKEAIPWVRRRRPGLPLHRCHRFHSSAYRSNQWRYRGRCDSIQFCVDRRIFVAGLGLYGSSNGAAEYKVDIELKRAGTSLAKLLRATFFSDGSSNVFPVYFDEAVQVEPDVFYTASAILDGTELSYFGQEGHSEVQIGRVTFQFQCSTESTNGTGVQGGQIPEILFYGS